MASRVALIVLAACGHAATPSPVAIAQDPPPADAAVAEVPVDASPCATFDPKDPACKGVCPESGELIGTDVCQCRTADPDLVACQLTMPCPDPPDSRVRRCHVPVAGEPVVARVIAMRGDRDTLLLTIAAGHEHGVDLGWEGVVLVGDTEAALPNGIVQLVRIDKRLAIGVVHLTVAGLGANTRVRLRRK